MREFKPNSFAINRSFYAKAMEARLSKSGEYVNHLPTDAPVQKVVMNYQHIPTDAEMPHDFAMATTNPTLFGLLDHFADLPRLYTEGNSVKPSKGSQFEVRGIIYNVKKVDVNHRNYLQIELVKANNCDTARDDFDDEMDELLCSIECK